jgi:Predicted nucleotide-binding protein containing TIR-like domain
MPQQTIFYSWQSDVGSENQSSDITKEFIFEAATIALKQIADDYEELKQVEIDRDTRGLSGTPAIVEGILNKIGESCLFIGDLTFVGETQSKPTTTDKTHDTKNTTKKLSNPNVLFELGYASTKLGRDRVICIMNTHYGDPKDLPFDIRHRRFPIQYHLSPNSSPSRINGQKKRLIEGLKVAILAAYSQGLFNRYVNEGYIRAARWIVRVNLHTAHALFDTIAHRFEIYPFQIADLQKIEAVTAHFTLENLKMFKSVSRVDSTPYLQAIDEQLTAFMEEIDRLLFRYTHLGGILIFSCEEVRLRAQTLRDQLRLIPYMNSETDPFQRTIQKSAKNLLLEIRDCYIQARTIRGEPIDG